MKRNSKTWIGASLLTLALLGLAAAQGMMGGGSGMMGGGMGGFPGTTGMGGPSSGMGGGMGMMAVYPATAKPIPKEQAERLLEAYAARLGPDAQIRDVMVFSNNYYAQVVNARGEGLGEVLVDRYTGNVFPEPGPNMTWNARAGFMGAPLGAVRYDLEAAQALAEGFLADYLPGAEVKAAQAFSGYYTFDFGRETVEGMLSVNAFTGEVWVHTWHGPFLGGDEE
nr:hypothetical protein [Marinithermus hydrothermalis]